ncbi:MAG: N-acetyltransferase [Planococcus sp. (in: firmicutes)]
MEIKTGENKFYIGNDSGDPDAEIHYVSTDSKVINIDHTYVSESLRGDGVGEMLVKKVVDHAREKDVQIKATCPFAKEEIENHPEFEDVLAKE